MNPWQYDQLMPHIAEVDRAFTDSENEWGVARLETLVAPETLASYRRGWLAWRKAIEASDLSAVQAVGPKMVAALAYMGKEALQRGHSPLAPVTWEAPLADGSVLVVCRTSAEASAVIHANKPPLGDAAIAAAADQQSGRQLVVWTLAELARVLPTIGQIDAIKRTWPGATVIAGPVTAEGDVADWARSDPTRHDLEF